MFGQVTVTTYDTPVGKLLLGAYKDRLCLADWKDRSNRAAIDRRIQNGLKVEYLEGTSDVIAQATKELDAYFQGKLHYFSIPIMPIGTPFQQAVWGEIAKIPYGNTVSYQTIAQHIGKPKAVRAVANAIGANALSLFIPCHRILRSSGNLGGYAGGVDGKQALLVLERRNMVSFTKHR